MKKLFFVCIVTILNWHAVAGEANELRAVNVSPYYPRLGEGNLDKIGDWRIYKDGIQHGFGPISVWESNEGGEPRQLTNSLATFDELCRKLVRSANLQPGTAGFAPIFSRIMVTYSGGLFDIYLTPESEPQYLEHLAKRMDADKLKRVKELIVPYNQKIADGAWSLEFTVVTLDGGIEIKKFTGRVAPFSVSSFEIKLVAPTKTVPEFGFLGFGPPEGSQVMPGASTASGTSAKYHHEKVR